MDNVDRMDMDEQLIYNQKRVFCTRNRWFYLSIGLLIGSVGTVGISYLFFSLGKEKGQGNSQANVIPPSETQQRWASNDNNTEHVLNTSATKQHNQIPQWTSNDNKREQGVPFIRWGRFDCPDGAETVYKGQVGGNAYNNKGGGVNYLCLPNDPENGEGQPFKNSALYGVEYQIFPGRQQPDGMSSDLGDKEAPCAVCYRKGRSALLMIPGRKTCYEGWNYEYNGYIMSDNVIQSSKDYVCVDRDAEPLDSCATNENHGLFVPIRTKCGSLRCPPYTDEADVRCVVCTR